MRSPHVRLLAFVLAILGTTAVSRGDRLVTVFSSATSDYLKRRSEDGRMKTETYVLMPGRFFEGRVKDGSLERAKFKDIAQVLANGLKRSSYFPAKSFEQADLLLIVHWGVTIGNDRNRELDFRDPYETHRIAEEYRATREAEIEAIVNPDPHNPVDPAISPASGGASRRLQEELDFRQLEASTNRLDAGLTGKTAADLLGFSPELTKDESRAMPSQTAKSLTSMLETDRYFVIVIAYDWQRWLKEHKLVRLWTSRLSISSPGVNFSIAVNRMSSAGAGSFGTSNPDLKIISTKKSSEKIVSGELIFIGYEPEKPPAKTK